MSARARAKGRTRGHRREDRRSYRYPPAGSPFNDYLIPGLILGGLFGIGSFVVAAIGLRRSLLAPFLAFAIGCAQMIWITVELAVIRQFSFLHPACFAVGLVIAVASVPWGWPTFQAMRANRLAGR